MNSEPIKKLTHLLKKILTATSSLTNVGIDYSHPDYDDDWSRSRLKLQPLLTHELHRPLALADDDDRRLQSRLLLRSASRMLVASTGSSSAAASGVHSGAASTAPSGSRSRRQLLLLLLLFLALQRRLSINTGESEESFYSNGISINVTKSHPEGADEDNKNHNMVALKHIINVPLSTLTTLSIKPGEPHFILWYFISSFFPLITACLGPVANMISVIGLIQHWRIDIATGVEKNDDGYLLALNIILLVLGILGNASLLMNFSGRVRYLVTQSMSISCWLVASLLLVIDVAVTKVKFFNGPVMVADTITGVITPTYYRPSEGYWYAVLTAGLYFICTLILSTNFLGYKLKKYPPTFNLGPKQRSLMIFTICLAVWLLAGAILFAHMIPNVTYGSSLYFCTVSILTIGLGDITPISWGSKVLVLAFSLIGVLIMGLIITMIRQVVLAAGGPTIFWHQIERDRLRLLEELMAKYKSGDENFTMSPTKAFREMRKIRRNAKIRQSHISLILTVVNFMIFWLLGATVFYFTEEWSYFNAVYFCFLCLITIGYGDFAPKTRLGRAFFVCWGIGAIPLMTILISNVGDTLYDIANRISYFMAKWFFPDYYRYLIEKRKKLKDERAKLNKLQHEDKKHKSGIKRGSFNDLRRLLTKGSIHPPDCDCCHKSKNLKAMKLNLSTIQFLPKPLMMIPTLLKMSPIILRRLRWTREMVKMMILKQLLMKWEIPIIWISWKRQLRSWIKRSELAVQKVIQRVVN